MMALAVRRVGNNNNIVGNTSSTIVPNSFAEDQNENLNCDSNVEEYPHQDVLSRNVLFFEDFS
jgi:hypothetical protein